MVGIPLLRKSQPSWPASQDGCLTGTANFPSVGTTQMAYLIQTSMAYETILAEAGWMAANKVINVFDSDSNRGIEAYGIHTSEEALIASIHDRVPLVFHSYWINGNFFRRYGPFPSGKPSKPLVRSTAPPVTQFRSPPLVKSVQAARQKETAKVDDSGTLFGVLVLSAIIGFVFWPAFILTGLTALELINASGETAKRPRANPTEMRTNNSQNTKPRQATAPIGSLNSTGNRSSTVNYASGAQGAKAVNLRSTKGSAVKGITEKVTHRKVEGVKNIAKVSPDEAPSQRLAQVIIDASDVEKSRSKTSHLGAILPLVQELGKQATAEQYRAEIRSISELYKIPHLVHFTRCENLPSILKYGLRSIESCDADEVQAIRNDSIRLDGQPDGISLSVTFPNYKMFYKYRQLDQTADWAVLILSPTVLWKNECGFFKYNAADIRMRNQPRAKVTTAQAFKEMLEPKGISREGWLRRCDPTDPQAEVMMYETINPSFIETIAFETKATSAKWKHVLGGIDMIYAGQNKGLFASRSQLRKN